MTLPRETDDPDYFEVITKTGREPVTDLKYNTSFVGMPRDRPFSRELKHAQF